LREGAIAAIEEDRQRRGPFDSFDDFLLRVPLDPNCIRLLIRAGAFDRLGFGLADRQTGLDLRPRLHWRLQEWEARTEGRQRRGDLLFPPELGPLPRPRPYGAAKLLRDEADTLGFLVSRHPLTLYRDDLLALRQSGVRAVRGVDLARHAGRRVTSIGWLVTGKVVTTKDDQPMEFVSFEDTTAIYETTFFPRAYERFCALLSTARPFVLRGRVDEDFGAVSLTVEQVSFLDAGRRPDRSLRAEF
jgi:error-prone DNA polymerase